MPAGAANVDPIVAMAGVQEAASGNASSSGTTAYGAAHADADDPESNNTQANRFHLPHGNERDVVVVEEIYGRRRLYRATFGDDGASTINSTFPANATADGASLKEQHASPLRWTWERSASSLPLVEPLLATLRATFMPINYPHSVHRWYALRV